MRLTWYGAASLIVESGERVIALDPFLGFPQKNRTLEETFRRASDVLITHGHFDHISDVPALYGRTDARIHGSRSVIRMLKKHGVPPSRLSVLASGDRLQLGGLWVNVYGGRHIRFDHGIIGDTVLRPVFLLHPLLAARLGLLQRRWPENSATLLFDLEENDVRLQILGSLGLDPAEEIPAGADALVLPFQGRSDLDTYALGIVERLRPGCVLLDHWDDAFPPVSREVDTRGIEWNVSERFAIDCRPLRWGDAVEIRRPSPRKRRGGSREIEGEMGAGSASDPAKNTARAADPGPKAEI